MTRVIVAVAACALGLGLLTAPAAARSPIDPVIDILPPAPVPYRPSTETACADGDPACIDATIEQMQARYDDLRSRCDHDAVFALAYLRVTENVRDAAAEGLYRDPAWLHHQDAVFAEDYFEAYDHWHAGRRHLVPVAWRIALQAADDQSVTALGNFMLAMNAHINRDFPYLLAAVGLTGADGVSHKADHNAFNARLDSLYQPVFAEQAAELDPTFDDADIGGLDDLGVGLVMRGWREMVWRHAEALVLARTPLARLLVRAQIETYAATQATLYRTLFSTTPGAVRDRNAFCTARHG
ncbi:hypothetical protein HMPREF0063_12728 [Aeromicrobium marinum DSM 15272]|uniref:Uncharacterized protein n=1 Tax=Aeromicrobium marinum DSM 15272 TaxID=585531 RepID=E2SFB9_9ACTN|nr:DUF5995 family protein [Aeromicrobium marinum]EFQ82204.1 hypothetical protein HMPREF0063_12728 [Aeromicrobium marinum DSM 15272]